MKKLLLSLALSCLLISTNAMAWWLDACTVDKINITTAGAISVVVTSSGSTSTRTLVMGNEEAKKMALAALMTAQSASGTVNLWIASGQATSLSLVKP